MRARAGISFEALIDRLIALCERRGAREMPRREHGGSSSAASIRRFDCRCPHERFPQASSTTFAEALSGRALSRRRRRGRRCRAHAVACARRGKRYRFAKRRISLMDSMHTPGVLVISGERIVSMNAGDAGSDAKVIDLGDVSDARSDRAHTHVAARVVSHPTRRPERARRGAGQRWRSGARQHSQRAGHAPQRFYDDPRCRRRRRHRPCDAQRDG